MNKAFIREPDHADHARCPRCGSLGLAVGSETLKAFLLPEAVSAVAESAFFCPYPTCEIVYFDVFDRCVGPSSVRRAVYPKDPNAPICGCFGLTRDDIDRDIAEGVVTRCKDLIAKSKTPAARCSIMAADGRSCVAEVQRYYMKSRQPSEVERPK
jgi:hypothetical protein